MTVIHNIASHSTGGLTGIQAAQRDWSPFLVHFTNWGAMGLIRQTVAAGEKPADVASLLTDADEDSFSVVEKIAASGNLRASESRDKQGKSHDIPACVCLSECNLPGLISHCERYGRFGFVLQKVDVFSAGGRPCAYVDRETYTMLDKRFSGSSDPLEKRLFGLSNLYSPPGEGRIQDYTHEREWRVFGNLMLKDLQGVLAPFDYFDRVRKLFPACPVLPIDWLHQWGA